MKPSCIAVVFFLAARSALAGSGLTPSSPDKDGKYWIRSNVLAAAFIPYGASIANLVLADRHGVERDVVAGYDNASRYGADAAHPHFGGVPGRYANRIRNSTFTLPDSSSGFRNTTYHVLPNEHPTARSPNGTNTVHGGPRGWDWRNWTVAAHSPSSITFSLADDSPDDRDRQGFPGGVVSFVTYAVVGARWEIKMVAIPTTPGRKTPVMLSSHTYWNLDGFANNETRTALNHSLWMPFARRRVAVDTILVPTGDVPENGRDGANDFWGGPKQLGASMAAEEMVGNCGPGCIGYDTCFVFDRVVPEDAASWRGENSTPVARLHSPWSGIQLDVFTEQAALQVYSCNGQDDTSPLKRTQGTDKFPRTIPQYGCVVLEVEDWIDGINHPEWGRMDRQVFEAGGKPYVLEASYRFGVNETAGFA